MLHINSLSARVARHRTLIDEAIARVVSSGWFVLGPEVEKFERSFAGYLGVAHCVAVANGTDAIELSLRAVGVKPGDCVATVANAGMYATSAVLAIGAEPYFMDVGMEARIVTCSEVARALEAGVQAVVVTHLFGLACPEIAEFSELCRQKGVPLLEDCAQAHGAKVGGKRVGTFGEAACFSFYPTKNLGALGDGGAVVTGSKSIDEKLRLLRQYGWTSKYRVSVKGGRNSRLDEVQAAILSNLLPCLDADNERRREIAARYSAEVINPGVVIPMHSGEEYVAHLFVVRCKDRASLQKHLKKSGIVSDVHYSIPDYQQPLFGDKFSELRLRNTETLTREILTLPCFPEMTEQQIGQVINAVNDWQP